MRFCFDTKSEKLVEAIESAQSSARSFLMRSLVEALHFLEGFCHFGMLRGSGIPFTPQSLMPARRRREYEATIICGTALTEAGFLT